MAGASSGVGVTDRDNLRDIARMRLHRAQEQFAAPPILLDPITGPSFLPAATPEEFGSFESGRAAYQV